MKLTVRRKDDTGKEEYGISFQLFGWKNRPFLGVWHNTILDNGGFTLRAIYRIIDDWGYDGINGWISNKVKDWVKKQELFVVVSRGHWQLLKLIDLWCIDGIGWRLYKIR